ncbi:MAG: porin family protein [Rhodothermales bacterium]
MQFRLLIACLFIGLMTPAVFPNAALIQSAEAQKIDWGISISSSFHQHEYEEPLAWWDNAGRVFPSVMLRSELPLSFIEGPLGKKLFLRTGVRYTRLASRVNWQFDVANTAEPFTGKFGISQHYLTIPLQFRLEIGRTPVYLLAGPEFGFLIFANKKSETLTPVEFESTQTESVGNDINVINLALGGGLGVQLSSRLRSFVRYSAGLSDAKKSADRTVLDTDWRTKEIEVGIEFAFSGRKDP